MTIKIHSARPYTIYRALLLALLLIGLPLSASADTLTVTVNNIKKAGEIHVAVYDNAKAFEADRGEKSGAAPGITEGTIAMVEPGSVTYVYELPPGTYAIGIFHDVNLNTKWITTFSASQKSITAFSITPPHFSVPPILRMRPFY